MKIDMSNPVQPVVDAKDIGTLFDINPAQVQSLMRRGKITSLLETGVDEHAGRFRLIFTYANKRVRLSCDATGAVSSTVRTPVSSLEPSYDPDLT